VAGSETRAGRYRVAEDRQIHADLCLCVCIERDHALRYGPRKAEVYEGGCRSAALKPSRFLLGSANRYCCRVVLARTDLAPASFIDAIVTDNAETCVDRCLHLLLEHSPGASVRTTGLLEPYPLWDFATWIPHIAFSSCAAIVMAIISTLKYILNLDMPSHYARSTSGVEKLHPAYPHLQFDRTVALSSLVRHQMHLSDSITAQRLHFLQ
jgi:hypothetical protein